MFLTLTILVSGGLITLMAYANELQDRPGLRRLLRSFWFKVTITSLLLIVMGVATVYKDKMAEQAQMEERKEQIRRDSINDIKNERDKLKIIETFSNGFARYALKIDNLLPIISDIKINSQPDGIILYYQLNKPVEKLTVTLGPSPFEDRFDKSHGAGWISLPTKIGANTYKISFKEFGLGSRITLLLKTENPYHSLPLIEHNHIINGTTDVFWATEDGSPISTDDGKKILVEKKK